MYTVLASSLCDTVRDITPVLNVGERGEEDEGIPPKVLHGYVYGRRGPQINMDIQKETTECMPGTRYTYVQGIGIQSSKCIVQ